MSLEGAQDPKGGIQGISFGWVSRVGREDANFLGEEGGGGGVGGMMEGSWQLVHA
jgi:hypothetical protein